MTHAVDRLSAEIGAAGFTPEAVQRCAVLRPDEAARPARTELAAVLAVNDDRRHTPSACHAAVLRLFEVALGVPR